jgi:hypothetical protein
LKLHKNIVVLVTLVSILAVFLLAGCGSGGGNNNGGPTLPNVNQADLVGTWKYSFIGQADASQQTACPVGFIPTGGGPFVAFCSNADVLTLNANHTFTDRVTAPDTTTVLNRAGTWSVSGFKLVLKVNGGGTETTAISLSADKKSFIQYFAIYTRGYAKQ